MPRQVTRRRFVKHSSSLLSASAVGFWSSRSIAESKSANDKLNIGSIGVGKRKLQKVYTNSAIGS